MHSAATPDPYGDNILIRQINPIPSPAEALQKLMYLPRIPKDVESIPFHVRTHYLMDVLDLHIPSLIERSLLQSVDLMVRQGYKSRDPLRAETWAGLYGEKLHNTPLLPRALGAAVEGVSGVGKTQGCLRSLHSLGPQTIVHEKFPRIAGSLMQVVWLSVEIPPSGKAADFARSLMTAWDQATGGRRFDEWLAKDKIANGLRALDEWQQVASAHFLGILHLDEVQNLFKLSSLEMRAQRKRAQAQAPELAIVEDQVLRWLLSLSNTGQIPLLVSGTPDGIGALSKRLSTLERLNTCGFHAFQPISDPSEPDYFGSFLSTLARYQYVAKPLVVNKDVECEIIDLTGGIQRVIVALWIAAHRVAYERNTDTLEIQDFRKAASTWLAPLAPAIAALKSQDPRALSRYDDLMRLDSAFWVGFWSKMRSG